MFSEEKHVLKVALLAHSAGQPLDLTESGLFWAPGCQDAVRLLVTRGLLEQTGRVTYALTPEGLQEALALLPEPARATTLQCSQCRSDNLAASADAPGACWCCGAPLERSGAGGARRHGLPRSPPKSGG